MTRRTKAHLISLSSVIALCAVFAVDATVLGGQTAVGDFLHVLIGGNRVTASSGTAVITLPNSTGTVVYKDTTDTLTNKTLNVESTGNVVTVLEKRWLSAGACQNATAVSTWSTPTSGAAAFTCQTGSNTQKAVLDFTDDGTTVISAQTSIMLPADFTSTVDARTRWLSSATSGNAKFSLASICVADAETSDPAFNTASTVTDATKGTTLQDNDASITTLTITGCAAGELLYLKLSRDPGDAADTLGATASVRGLELTFRRAQ